MVELDTYYSPRAEGSAACGGIGAWSLLYGAILGVTGVKTDEAGTPRPE